MKQVDDEVGGDGPIRLKLHQAAADGFLEHAYDGLGCER
jgi:hypothetical protein